MLSEYLKKSRSAESAGHAGHNASGRSRGAFQEVWFLKANQASPTGEQAIWLRFTLLVSSNGFRRVAEVWAIFSQRGAQREVIRHALKRTFPIEELRASVGANSVPGVQIDTCVLTSEATRGELSSKGKTIQWDLQFKPGAVPARPIDFVPAGLRRAGIVRGTAVTECADLQVSGRIEIDGARFDWSHAEGMVGHFSGPRSAHSWTWAHANRFVDAEGRPQPFVFEGITARTMLLGPLTTPRLSSFYFHYRGQDYLFNSVWDSLRIQSSATWTQWTFRAERGELLFRGRCAADLKDFAGLTYEDTHGSFIHCAGTQLADIEIQVYRQAKLEASLNCRGAGGFEVASRARNPYVPSLI